MEGQSGPCRGAGRCPAAPYFRHEAEPGSPALAAPAPQGFLRDKPEPPGLAPWSVESRPRDAPACLSPPGTGRGARGADSQAVTARAGTGGSSPVTAGRFWGGPGRPHSGAPGKALVRGRHGHPGPAPGRRGPSGTDGASSCRGLARPRLAPRLSPGPRGLCPPPHPMPSPVLPSRTQVPRYPFGQTGISPPLGSPLRLLPAERLPELPLPALWCLPAPPPPADS